MRYPAKSVSETLILSVSISANKRSVRPAAIDDSFGGVLTHWQAENAYKIALLEADQADSLGDTELQVLLANHWMRYLANALQA